MITKEQSKSLLQNYNLIPAKIKALESAIRTMTGNTEKDDDIASSCLAQKMDGMPFAADGNTTDKTAACALSQGFTHSYEIPEHSRACGTLKYVKEQIDIAVSALSESKRVLVNTLLINGVQYGNLTQDQLQAIGYYGKTTALKKANEAASTIGSLVVFGAYEYGIAARALNIVE